VDALGVSETEKVFSLPTTLFLDESATDSETENN